MKKLLTIIILISLSFITFSQTSESAELSASANIISMLSIDNLNDLSFGNVSRTTLGDVKIDPQGLNTSNSSYVGTTAEIGEMKIIGSNATSVNLIFPTSILLSNGTTSMTLVLDVNGSDNSANQASSTDLTSGDDITTHSTNGDYYLWVGGNLGTLNNQQLGLYTGTATFEVSYN